MRLTLLTADVPRGQLSSDVVCRAQQTRLSQAGAEEGQLAQAYGAGLALYPSWQDQRARLLSGVGTCICLLIQDRRGSPWWSTRKLDGAETPARHARRAKAVPGLHTATQSHRSRANGLRGSCTIFRGQAWLVQAAARASAQIAVVAWAQYRLERERSRTEGPFADTSRTQDGSGQLCAQAWCEGDVSSHTASCFLIFCGALTRADCLSPMHRYHGRAAVWADAWVQAVEQFHGSGSHGQLLCLPLLSDRRPRYICRT